MQTDKLQQCKYEEGDKGTTPPDVEDTEDIVHKLKNNRAPDIDGLPAKLLTSVC